MSTTEQKMNREVTESGYASVNGLNMYYEMEGQGKPLIYIPPVFGYSGVNFFPHLNKIRTVITVDLQGHGRTTDIDRPISFEQHAHDVVGLLKHLGIEKADFFGESFGGVIATLIAVHNPKVVDRLATYASVFGNFQEAMKPEMLATSLSLSPDANGIQFQRDNYKKVAPDPSYWPTIWSKVGNVRFQGFSQEELASLKMPVLIAVGDHDFIRLEHSFKTFQQIPNGELAVIPDAGHFVLNSDQTKLIPVVVAFLEAPSNKPPFGTTSTGYHPGETR